MIIMKFIRQLYFWIRYVLQSIFSRKYKRRFIRHKFTIYDLSRVNKFVFEFSYDDYINSSLTGNYKKFIFRFSERKMREILPQYVKRQAFNVARGIIIVETVPYDIS